jgi:hypothetical protein
VILTLPANQNGTIFPANFWRFVLAWLLPTSVEMLAKPISYSDPSQIKALPSPNELKGKILVKNKTLKTFAIDEAIADEGEDPDHKTVGKGIRFEISS